MNNNFNPFEFLNNDKYKKFHNLAPEFLGTLKELVDISDQLNSKIIKSDAMSNVLSQFMNAGPKSEVSQTDSEVVVEVEIPGLAKNNNISAKIEGSILYIEGKRRRESSNMNDYSTIFSNYQEWSFSKIIPLPAAIKAENAHAVYHDGILEIRIPKDHSHVSYPLKVQFL